MDLFTVIGSLVASLVGLLTITGLNIPEGGTILAIAFIGGRIVGILKKQNSHSNDGVFVNSPTAATEDDKLSSTSEPDDGEAN